MSITLQQYTTVFLSRDTVYACAAYATAEAGSLSVCVSVCHVVYCIETARHIVF